VLVNIRLCLTYISQIMSGIVWDFQKAREILWC